MCFRHVRLRRMCASVAACCGLLQCVAVCRSVGCSMSQRVVQWVAACVAVCECTYRLECTLNEHAGCAFDTHCNTLQHTASHCNTLQSTTTHCNTLRPVTVHCNALQRTVTHYNTLYHTENTVTHCSTLQHTATHCNTLRTLPHTAENLTNK